MIVGNPRESSIRAANTWHGRLIGIQALTNIKLDRFIRRGKLVDSADNWGVVLTCAFAGVLGRGKIGDPHTFGLAVMARSPKYCCSHTVYFGVPGFWGHLRSSCGGGDFAPT